MISLKCFCVVLIPFQHSCEPRLQVSLNSWFQSPGFTSNASQVLTLCSLGLMVSLYGFSFSFEAFLPMISFTDLKMRHKQMSDWIRQRMIPIYKKDDRDIYAQTAPISYGSLRQLWLGGLVNPCALFTALRQEKAVISNKFIDEVRLSFKAFQLFHDRCNPRL